MADVDQGMSEDGPSCPDCGEANAAGAARCAACGASLAARPRPAPVTASAAPAPALETEPHEADDFDDRKSKRAGPRCPNCGAHMERGSVEISQKMLDVIFTTLSAHSLFFFPIDGKRREILKAGQRRRAMLCPICGGFWMR
jgi:predicted RNA-binding Zn-ribbon protein involved in translation (DUF1610 family)